MRSAPPSFNPAVAVQPVVQWETQEQAQAAAKALGATAGAVGGSVAWVALRERLGLWGAALPVLGAAAGYALWAGLAGKLDVVR